jgi:hypothetical protein
VAPAADGVVAEAGAAEVAVLADLAVAVAVAEARAEVGECIAYERIECHEGRLDESPVGR